MVDLKRAAGAVLLSACRALVAALLERIVAVHAHSQRRVAVPVAVRRHPPALGLRGGGARRLARLLVLRGGWGAMQQRQEG